MNPRLRSLASRVAEPLTDRRQAVRAGLVPPALAVSGVVGLVSWGLGGVGAIVAGFAYGWDSEEFQKDVGLFLAGAIFMGQGKLLEKFGSSADDVVHWAGSAGEKVYEVGNAVAGGIGGLFDW